MRGCDLSALPKQFVFLAERVMAVFAFVNDKKVVLSGIRVLRIRISFSTSRT